jgi:hypothetical protein
MLEFINAVALEVGGAMLASFFLLNLCLGRALPPVARAAVVRRQRDH